MKKDKGNLTEISDLGEITVPSEVPAGIISTQGESERLAVDERDVEIIREWNKENKL